MRVARTVSLAIRAFLLSLAACSTTIPGGNAPPGFVTQTLGTTGGSVERPAGWVYDEASTPDGWRWTITESEPAPDGFYATGAPITLHRDVRHRTGTMVRLLAQDQDRQSPSRPVRLGKVVVAAWWDDLGMVVTVASRAPPGR